MTTLTEYTPGEWLAVVAPGRVALLPPTTSACTLVRLWASMREVDDASLLHHLQALADGDLTSLPPFALLSATDGRLHVAVRGAVEVTTTVAGRTRVLTAPQVSTWSEEVLDGVERVDVRAPGAGGAHPGAGVLPLVSGVVRAGAVSAVVQVTADGDEPIAEPTPAPERELVLAEVGASGCFAHHPAAAPVEQAPAPAAGPAAPAVASRLPWSAAELDAVLDEPLDNTLLRPTATEGILRGAGVPASAELRDLDVDLDVDLDAELADLDEPAADSSPDHDGTTVLGEELVALRRQLPEWTGHAAVAPMVAPAPATPTPARIALSTGERVSLSRPVLIGRAPQASRVPSGQVPRLVTVPSPLQDISRTHAEVRMDGDDVVLTDLRSTNGVLVVHPGSAPQRLQPGEATVLQPGVLVDLGEDITFTVERGA